MGYWIAGIIVGVLALVVVQLMLDTRPRHRDLKFKNDAELLKAADAIVKQHHAQQTRSYGVPLAPSVKPVRHASSTSQQNNTSVMDMVVMTALLDQGHCDTTRQSSHGSYTASCSASSSSSSDSGSSSSDCGGGGCD